MKFVPELNLNKHPKDCKDYSLIDALNIKLSNDLSCLQNENALENHNVIGSDYFNNVIGVIECNKELVIFNKKNEDGREYIEIIRYSEGRNTYNGIGLLARKEVNGTINLVNYDENTVKIKGTFTYNINNDLIISFIAVGTDEPVYTANLGRLKENGSIDTTRWDIENTYIGSFIFKALFLNKASLVPEVRLPNIENIQYVKGNNYKGWYHFFIRYKITEIDYTQWYHIGYPILINSIKQQNIVKYYHWAGFDIDVNRNDTVHMGCSDYFGEKGDITNEAVEFILNNLDSRYEKYQIGCICVNNTANKAFCGYDIDIKTGSSDVNKFVVDGKYFTEYNSEDILLKTYNYFNVDNIFNYKNRLYIGNYKEENNIVKRNELQNHTDINVSFKSKTIANCQDDSIKAVDNTYGVENYDAGEPLNPNHIPYIDTNKTFNYRRLNKTLIPGTYYKFYIHYVDKYGIATEGYEINKLIDDSDNNFVAYINLNKDKIFKLNVNVINPTFENTSNPHYVYNLYKLDIKVNNIPNGYVGYFISYEKFEKNLIHGIVAEGDLIDNEEWRFDSGLHKTYVPEKKVGENTKTSQFFSEELYEDNIKTNYTKIKKYIRNITNGIFNVNNKTINPTLKFDMNFNAPALPTEDIDVTTDIIKLDYRLANDYPNGRANKGTCFDISPNVVGDNKYEAYGCALFHDNFLNLYLNKEKSLIRFTNILTNIGTFITVDGAYNGCLTFNCPLIYCKDGVKLTAVNVAYRDRIDNYALDEMIDERKSKVISQYTAVYDDTKYVTKFIQYAQMLVYNDYFYETKEFKNNPENKLYNKFPQEGDDLDILYESGLFVLPMNSIDLFINRIKSQDTYYPITYINFNLDNYRVDEFNKTVRRSAVMSDEGFDNNWRKFPIEDYKQIAENKGSITNIVGIGNYLIVHTEHSMFAFNANAKLKNTEGGDIQISNPDIWDVQYQEVTPSELGMCGLQDSDAWILDEFGYIFYDNDAHRIYKFGAGKIDRIDTNIEMFLNKYKPYEIRFGEDKESSRLLMNIKFNNKTDVTDAQQICLSYNYKTGTFISRHSYNFKEAYKTKQIGYFKDYTTNLIKVFNYNNKTNINYASNSELTIICNTEYDVIKTLEFIMYKLYKVENLSELYIPNPVEGTNGQRKVPYSGISLQVLSDLCKTAVLDITTNIIIDRPDTDNSENYKKPHFDLGNWNYSYLRDIRNENMRINGNYFILHFVLNNNENNRVEFEGIECQVLKYR